ncbi:MAG: Hsp70 family protein, partial [Planctomycetales bacterium]
MASTEPAVGIDLGTTYSAAAHLDASGRPVTLLNAEGDSITPSAVLCDEDGGVVGMEALKAAALEPDRVALFAKRDMGNPFYRQPINGEHIPPEIVQSLVLEKLKRDAQARIGVFKKVVVTVPAYFNEPRRKATQDAGQLAGLDVIDIINEPTAAALAFGMQAGFLAEDGTSPRQERILVYDLGGGTFDVTLMDVEGNRFTTVATDGDVYLGGVDWDQRIIDYLGEQFQQRFHGQDPRKNPAGLARLRREAEDAKRALTSRSKVNVSVEFGGEGARIPLTREHFEE